MSNITSEQDGHSYTSKQSTSSPRYQQKKQAAYNRKLISTGYDDPTLVGDVKVDNSEAYYQRNESDESYSEGKDNYTSSFYSYATSDDEDRSVDGLYNITIVFQVYFISASPRLTLRRRKACFLIKCGW